MTVPPANIFTKEPIDASALARGVCRALDQLGYAALLEFPLANGRRTDVLALGRRGEIIAVEVKSSVADFRADQKWPSYREFADRLYFAVASGFPTSLIPDDCGLMVADAFGAEVFRDGQTISLAPGRRRALTLRFARIAAARVWRSLDPEAARFAGR